MEKAIHVLIPEVMKKVGAIKKDKVNTFQKFQFRGIEQFYLALNPVFQELGIFVIPVVKNIAREERAGKSSVNIWTVLTIDYHIHGPMGDKIVATVIGEAFDSGDKGANKALSAGLKYLLTQIFLIPTEDLPDADADSPEIPNEKQAPKGKATGQQKASDSTSTAGGASSAADQTATKETPANDVPQVTNAMMDQLLQAAEGNGWDRKQLTEFCCANFGLEPKTFKQQFTEKQWRIAVALVSQPKNAKGKVVVKADGKPLPKEHQWESKIK